MLHFIRLSCRHALPRHDLDRLHLPPRPDKARPGHGGDLALSDNLEGLCVQSEKMQGGSPAERRETSARSFAVKLPRMAEDEGGLCAGSTISCQLQLDIVVAMGSQDDNRLDPC